MSREICDILWLLKGFVLKTQLKLKKAPRKQQAAILDWLNSLGPADLDDLKLIPNSLYTNELQKAINALAVKKRHRSIPIICREIYKENSLSIDDNTMSRTYLDDSHLDFAMMKRYETILLHTCGFTDEKGRSDFYIGADCDIRSMLYDVSDHCCFTFDPDECKDSRLPISWLQGKPKFFLVHYIAALFELRVWAAWKHYKCHRSGKSVCSACLFCRPSAETHNKKMLRYITRRNDDSVNLMREVHRGVLDDVMRSCDNEKLKLIYSIALSKRQLDDDRQYGQIVCKSEYAMKLWFLLYVYSSFERIRSISKAVVRSLEDQMYRLFYVVPIIDSWTPAQEFRALLSVRLNALGSLAVGKELIDAECGDGNGPYGNRSLALASPTSLPNTSAVGNKKKKKVNRNRKKRTQTLLRILSSSSSLDDQQLKQEGIACEGPQGSSGERNNGDDAAFLIHRDGPTKPSAEEENEDCTDSPPFDSLLVVTDLLNVSISPHLLTKAQVENSLVLIFVGQIVEEVLDRVFSCALIDDDDVGSGVSNSTIFEDDFDDFANFEDGNISNLTDEEYAKLEELSLCSYSSTIDAVPSSDGESQGGVLTAVSASFFGDSLSMPSLVNDDISSPTEAIEASQSLSLTSTPTLDSESLLSHDFIQRELSNMTNVSELTNMQIDGENTSEAPQSSAPPSSSSVETVRDLSLRRQLLAFMGRLLLSEAERASLMNQDSIYKALLFQIPGEADGFDSLAGAEMVYRAADEYPMNQTSTYRSRHMHVQPRFSPSPPGSQKQTSVHQSFISAQTSTAIAGMIPAGTALSRVNMRHLLAQQRAGAPVVIRGARSSSDNQAPSWEAMSEDGIGMGQQLAPNPYLDRLGSSGVDVTHNDARVRRGSLGQHKESTLSVQFAHQWAFGVGSGSSGVQAGHGTALSHASSSSERTSDLLSVSALLPLQPLQPSGAAVRSRSPSRSTSVASTPVLATLKEAGDGNSLNGYTALMTTAPKKKADHDQDSYCIGPVPPLPSLSAISGMILPGTGAAVSPAGCTRSNADENDVESLLSKEIRQFVSYVDAKENYMTRAKADVLKKMKIAVKNLWPRAQVKAFGSFMSGLSLPTSDLDMVICLPKVHWEAGPDLPGVLEGRNAIKESWQQNLARYLRKEPWVIADSIKVIPNAPVPVLKLKTRLGEECTDSPTIVSLDVSFEGPGHRGLEANKLIMSLVHDYPSLRSLVLVLKHFLSRKTLCESFTGGLSSYALLLMIALYLEEVSSDHKTHRYAALAGRATAHAPSALPAVEQAGLSAYAVTDLGALLLGFLHFFGDKFDPRQTGLSIRRRCYFSRVVRAAGVGAAPGTFVSVPLPQMASLSGTQLPLDGVSLVSIPMAVPMTAVPISVPIHVPMHFGPPTDPMRRHSLTRMTSETSHVQFHAVQQQQMMNAFPMGRPFLSSNLAPRLPFKFDPLFIEDPLEARNNVGRNCFRIYQIQRCWSEAFASVVQRVKSLDFGIENVSFRRGDNSINYDTTGSPDASRPMVRPRILDALVGEFVWEE